MNLHHGVIIERTLRRVANDSNKVQPTIDRINDANVMLHALLEIKFLCEISSLCVKSVQIPFQGAARLRRADVGDEPPGKEHEITNEHEMKKDGAEKI